MIRDFAGDETKERHRKIKIKNDQEVSCETSKSMSDYNAKSAIGNVTVSIGAFSFPHFEVKLFQGSGLAYSNNNFCSFKPTFQVHDACLGLQNLT